MVQRSGSAGQGKVLFVQNNFYYDAFFLKAIGASFLLRSFVVLMSADLSAFVVLNGACDNGWCTTPNSSTRYHVSIFPQKLALNTVAQWITAIRCELLRCLIQVHCS